jgi:phosphoenolpyruvate synthase/pyruvate phosphate dikinase
MAKRISVKNMVSSAGNPVPNQFIITDDYCETFQSYETTIGLRYRATGQIVLDYGAWDYSTTTSKYRNKWLGFDSKAVKAKIASGEISLANLN